MGAKALIKKHRARLKNNLVMFSLMVDEIQGPGLIGLIRHMHDATHHMRIDPIAMHVQPGARAIAAHAITPTRLERLTGPRFDQRRELVIGQLLQRFRHRGVAQIRRLGADRRNPGNHISSIRRITFQRIPHRLKRHVRVFTLQRALQRRRSGEQAKRSRRETGQNHHDERGSHLSLGAN